MRRISLALALAMLATPSATLADDDVISLLRDLLPRYERSWDDDDRRSYRQPRWDRDDDDDRRRWRPRDDDDDDDDDDD